MAANREDGFSLVELIVVVSIIAILLGIAIPSFIGNRARATRVACQAQARYVYQAVTAYNTATGGNPTATFELLTAGDTPYLQPAPVASSSCTISIVVGVTGEAEVWFAAPANASSIRFDPKAFSGGGADVAGIGTTTVLAAGTTTTAAGATTTTAATVPTSTATTVPTTTATTVAASTTTAVTVAPLAAPTGVTATCYVPPDGSQPDQKKRVTVTWTAVPRAAIYSVVYSTVSASSGFVEIASYVAGTSFTTGALGYSTVWFQVIAHLGTTASANSATSNSRQITNAPGCL